MRASRWLALPLAALLGGAIVTPAAQADTPVRIYVGLGDVLFDGGHPYYRYDHSPVYVVHDEYRRARYYRYAAPPRYYAPVSYVATPRYYAPVRYVAPPRYYATPVHYRPMYNDYRKHDGDDQGGDHDRGKSKGKGKGKGHD